MSTRAPQSDQIENRRDPRNEKIIRTFVNEKRIDAPPIPWRGFIAPEGNITSLKMIRPVLLFQGFRCKPRSTQTSPMMRLSVCRT